MSAQAHTPLPWFLSTDGYSILATRGVGRWPGKTVAPPLYIAEVCDTDMEADEAVSNARRIVAAVRATKDFTTDGLELIAAGGFEARLALLASLMLEEIRAKGQMITLDDEAETGEYPLSRGD